MSTRKAAWHLFLCLIVLPCLASELGYLLTGVKG